VAATAMALLILELIVRVSYLAPLSEEGAIDGAGGLKAILQFDSTLETHYAPNSATRVVSPYGEYDVSYRINSLGLRDGELATKPDNEFRILVAGNSFVEGWGVKESDAFVRVAERVANRPGWTGIGRVRLINAGISAYGAAQSYLQMKSL